MEVKIKDFRCIQNWSAVIQNGLTLFKGESGSGKSTVLEAIRWCLYGQLRQVFPFNGQKKTSVTVILDDITITRSKNPEELTWCCQEVMLQSSEAQAQINKLFGSKEIWQNSSYISQESRNILLAGSHQDKIKLIKELVFSEDTDKSNQLFNLFKEKKDILQRESQQYNYLISRLNDKIKDYKQKYKEDLEQIRNNFYQSKLFKSKELLMNKALELEDKIKANKEQVVINKIIDENKKILTDNIEKIQYYPEELDQKKYIQWQKYLESKEALTNLVIDKDTEIKESLDELIRFYGIYENNKKIMKKYKIEETDIKEEIKKCNLSIDNNYQYNNYIQQYKTYQNYQQNIDKYDKFYKELLALDAVIFRNYKFVLIKLDMEFKKYSPDYMVIMEEKLKAFKNGFMKCPDCDSKLQIKEGKLIKCQLALEPETISKIEKIMSNIKKYHSNIQECKDKLDTLQESNIPEPEKIEEPQIKDIDILKEKHLDLSKYQFIESDNIIKKISILKLREKGKQLEDVMKLNYHAFYEKYNIDNEDYFGHFIECKNNIKQCKKYLQSCEEKEIIDIAKEEKLLVRVEEKLNDIKTQENLYEIKKELTILEKEYKDEKDKYDLAIEQIRYCDKIIKIIQESENESFQQFILYFNALVNDILVMLFDNCSIDMKAFKENSKEIKAQIDMHIFINGQKYDNWHLLSGGEKDRISLAITIALAYIKNVKFLLLDECMASLDGLNREKCLRVFKKYVSNKIVINICHETIEGYYDYIINYCQ